MSDITQSEVKQLLKYNAETGTFTWKESGSGRRSGGIAGSVTPFGYVVISVKRNSYRAHRLAWFITFGEWPKHQIDHINHQRTDNRIENLRETTNQGNHRNQSMSKNNTSGVCGVYQNKALNKWQALIKVNGKLLHLGFFKNKTEAVEARKSAERKYGFHENHGK